jgi:hypothetical protein
LAIDQKLIIVLQQVDQNGNVIPAEDFSPEWNATNGVGSQTSNNTAGEENPSKPNGLDRSVGSTDSVRMAVSQDISLHNLNDHN